jgi:hypothetical protein
MNKFTRVVATVLVAILVLSMLVSMVAPFLG